MGSAAGPESVRPRETTVPIRGARRATAQTRTASAFTAPHATGWVTIDVTETVSLLERLKGTRNFRDVEVSPILVVARALCLALPRTPELNASWDEENQEIVHRNYVNLGIAVGSPQGPIVPNIKDANLLGLPELAGALGELSRTAQTGGTRPADLSGGSFTIADLDALGLDAATAILSPGESGLLTFGAIRRKPWVVTRNGRKTVAARDIMTLGLSSDHRVIDGEQASKLLTDVASILEDPEAALFV